MKAMKNLLHGVILLVWALLGTAFTLHTLFGAGPSLHGLFLTATWWLWFAGLAALTTMVVVRLKSAVGPLWVHSLVLLGLLMIPRVCPLSLLRLGVDLLSRGA